MNSDVIQQLAEIIKLNQSFAIVLKEQWTTDDLATAVAWQLFLKGKNKNSTIFCSGKKPDERFNFLNISDIKQQLLGKKYQIKIDVSQSGVNELSYSVEDNTLKIFITPNKGLISDKDIKLQSTNPTIDAVICIGMEEHNNAGKLFADQSEIFYNLPLINIDHQPENIRYGTINLIDITACSNCEISYEIITKIEQGELSNEIATALLTGIIDSTQSFLRGKVSPKSFKIAGHLLELGAKRDKIVGHLYQTKTVEQLRLWGNALKELKELANGKFLLTQLDDPENKIETEKISGIVHELLINNPITKVAALILKQKNDNYFLILANNRSYDLSVLLNFNGGESPIILSFDNENILNETINKITEYLSQF